MSLLTLQNFESTEVNSGKLNNEEINVSNYDHTGNTAEFDIEIEAREKGNVIDLYIEYSTKLFKKERICDLGRHYINILKSIVENPDAKISAIEMLDESERKQILIEFNDNKIDFPKNKTIHQMIEERAKETPNDVAISFATQDISYKTLNNKANKLARYI